LASGEVAATQTGTAIYRRHCAACHGEKGDGRSLAREALAARPRDFTAKDARKELTREYMIAIVRDGRPHKPMVGRAARLSQEEIEAVVDHIRAAFMPP
jgi:mono/diheme cytochrome c family protein